MCLLRGTDWVFIYNSTFSPHSVFMCFVWIREQTSIISLYSIKWLVCVTDTECLLRGTDRVFIYNSDILAFTYIIEQICCTIIPLILLLCYLLMLYSYETVQSVSIISFSYLHISSAHTPQHNAHPENGITCDLWQGACASLPTSFSLGSKFRRWSHASIWRSAT